MQSWKCWKWLHFKCSPRIFALWIWSKWNSTPLKHEHMDSVNTDHSLLFVWTMIKGTGRLHFQNMTCKFQRMQVMSFPSGRRFRQFLLSFLVGWDEKTYFSHVIGSPQKIYIKRSKNIPRGHSSHYKHGFLFSCIVFKCIVTFSCISV